MDKSYNYENEFSPVRIFGNLYFVGTVPASTHILDTGEGLIMFDSGYRHSLHVVLHNMELMNLNPTDLKYIIHTHGHIDHFGATRELVRPTGAKTIPKTAVALPRSSISRECIVFGIDFFRNSPIS